ncbi:hypothetical protein [Methylocapsa acidiphila]|uniref:hypothetical protein n=1 Tax=Methylocapsa acidiphila TaxID=133552 RepID=UPI000684A504|nr:hypothetical protein [Methylocapsa acidiphila]
MRRRAAAVALSSAFLEPLAAAWSPAAAVSMDKSRTKDECVVRIGAEAVQIAAYQPDYSLDKYCEALPTTGRTILAFDLATNALRDAPIEIKIVKDTLASLGDSEGSAEAVLPARAYPSGTFYFEHNFKQSGQYIVLMSVARLGGATETAQFKFAVGASVLRLTPVILVVALAAPVLLASWKFGRKRLPPGSRSGA